ncbi:hypothetical protein D3C74_264720 [compost metagenome]
MGQRLVGGQFVLRQAAAPEAVARTADIPVAQLVDKPFNRLRGVDEIINRQSFVNDWNQAVQTGQDPAIQLILRRPVCMLLGIVAVDAGVQRQERMGVHERVDHFGLGFSNDSFGEPFAVPRRTVGQEGPTEGVRAELFDDFPRIDNVTFGFGHLLPVFVQHVTGGDDRFVRRFTGEQRGHGQQAVKPAARLVDPFADHVRRELIAECLLVLERIMMLCKRHRTAVEPHIDHFARPFHHSAFAVRAMDLHFIHIRFMQLKIFTDMTYRMFPQLGDAVRRKLPAAVWANPHVQRRAPIAVPADVPIDQFFEELAEAAFTDMPWIPFNRIVVGDQLILHRSRFDKPALHCIVEQRRFTTPAERIAMLVFLFAVQGPLLGQHLNDVEVTILYETAGKIGHHVGITPLAINNTDKADAVLAADAVVVFAMCRSHVYDPRTAGVGNERCAYDHVDVLGLNVGERRSIGFAHEFRTFMRRQYRVIAFHDFLDQVLGDDVYAVLLFYSGVFHVRIHSEGHVGWQRPRRSRPG